VIIAAALLISFVAGLSLGLDRAGPGGPPEIPPVEAVPAQDIPGEDVPGLPRYPGAVRVKYESHLLGDVHVLEVGYLVEGRVHEAGSFYRRRLDENGWSFEGSDFDAGELALRARRGEVEMLVELGQADELVEIEMELSEPLPSLAFQSPLRTSENATSHAVR
jgi:hypothetical protein